MNAPSPFMADLGPVLPPRLQVYATAVEVQALARIAVEASLAGPGCDLARALAQLDKCRAVLGGAAPFGEAQDMLRDGPSPSSVPPQGERDLGYSGAAQ